MTFEHSECFKNIKNEKLTDTKFSETKKLSKMDQCFKQLGVDMIDKIDHNFNGTK